MWHASLISVLSPVCKNSETFFVLYVTFFSEAQRDRPARHRQGRGDGRGGGGGGDGAGAPGDRGSGQHVPLQGQQPVRPKAQASLCLPDTLCCRCVVLLT